MKSHRKMAADQRPPSFFHILINPSSPHMPLPPVFVTKHLGNEILEDPIIKTANGGYLWKLKMKKMDDDHGFCFVDGWCNVVTDVGLSFGEFLLFRYVGRSGVFFMHVYSINGCEKILVPQIKVVDYGCIDDDDDEVEEEEEDVVYDMDDDDDHHHHHVEDGDDVEFDDDDDEVEEKEDVVSNMDDDDHHHHVEDDDDDDDHVEDDDDDVEDEDDVEFDDDDKDEDDDMDEDDVLYDVDDDDDVEDEDDVEFVYDRDDDNDDVDVDGDDGDPFFILTSSKSNRNKLRFSPDFVDLARIDTRETITLKNDDGCEKIMTVQTDKKSTSSSYYVAAGWKEFQRNNGISEGDKCVFKFIASEDKICLVKVTKKKTPARPLPSAIEAPLTEVDADDVEDDDGMEYKDAEDEDEDVELVDEDDPFFVVTITPTHNRVLRMPADFVRSARIDSKRTVRVRSLDGKEMVMPVQFDTQYGYHAKRYFLLKRWKDFMQGTNISEGDKCVFKFIIREDKLCVANITKPAAEALPTEVNDDDDKDENEDAGPVDDVDPFFVATITAGQNSRLYMANDFVRFAGIDTKENIVMISLDGNECQMDVRKYKKKVSTSYHLYRWNAFMRSNNISQGDKCVFKYLTSEDKMCLAKIIKAPAREVYVDDMDPSFVATITITDKYMLRLPPGFVALSRIDTKENIIMKSLDGNESQMAVRLHKRVNSAQYYLSLGWVAFKQSKNISQGDECVFKYITSEDKMCLVKITKPSAKEVDDGMDETDPFFVETVTPSRKSMLLLPTDFVALARIGTKENIIIKSLDGKETQIALQSYKLKWSTRYCFSVGWAAFKRSNNISDGDECVFKYIKSEDKMCLEKITKKITRPTLVPTKVDNDDMDDKDGKGEDAQLVDEDDVNDSKEDDYDVDDSNGDDYDVDEDPSFIWTISNSNQKRLNLPIAFVKLAGIATKKNITMISRDGNERQMVVGNNNDKRNRSTRYHLTKGWPAFTRSNNLSQGDKCVFKFITSEDKMFLAKIVKAPVKKVDVDYDDPSFVVTMTTMNKAMLRLPSEFVALAKIGTKENIIVKSLDGNERQMAIQSFKRYRCLIQYHFSIGWPAFRRSNNISEGDECVFKYIRGEDKLCLVKVTKRKIRARSLAPAVVAPEKVDTDDDGISGKGLGLEDDNDKDEDEDEDVELVDDGDPSFVATIFPYEMHLPADFVRSAGIDTKKTLTFLGLDGYEMEMTMRCYKHSGGFKRYYVAKGWSEFRRNNDILEGDKCVFKFITSDDKLCLAKINKKKTPTRTLPPATADDAKDENEDVERVDHEDPFFVVTISHKFILRLPSEFVALAKIDTKENIIIKSIDGNERQMAIQSYKQYRSLIRYHFSIGWPAFRRSNNISEGDECVFKYIRSEDKLCLVKVTKRKTQPRLPHQAVVETEVEADDAEDDKDAEDDNDKDKDEDAEFVVVDDDDDDPFFVATITRSNFKTCLLRMPVDFVRSAGIDTKKNITLKRLDGYEKEIHVRCDSRYHYHSKRYCLRKGWMDFARSTNISVGDRCLFKFITSEDKLCLAKITKAQPTEVDDDDVEVRSGMDDTDADRNVELVDGIDGGDPFFEVTITTIHKSMLGLPSAFVGLSGIDAKENIIIISLDGNERLMPLRSYQQNNSTHYCLSMGWPAFMRSNSISEGDECVFKYITSEDKMCLAKVTNTKTQARLSSPVKVLKRKRGRPTKVVKRKRGRPAKITMTENVKVTVEEVVKRKRGRPTASSRATENVNRPRGRPAKRLCGKALQQE